MEFDRIDLESRLFVEKRMREADQWRLELAARSGQRGGAGDSADGLFAAVRSAGIRAGQAIRFRRDRPEPQCC